MLDWLVGRPANGLVLASDWMMGSIDGPTDGGDQDYVVAGRR